MVTFRDWEGKTIGLASHWPCVTDFVVLVLTTLKAQWLRQVDEHYFTNSKGQKKLFIFTILCLMSAKPRNWGRSKMGCFNKAQTNC